MSKRAAADPKVYLSSSEGRFRVMLQGMPVSTDRDTKEEAIEVAERLGVKGLSDRMWDGDKGVWAPLA